MSVTKGQQQARRVFAKYCQDIDHALGGYAISDEDGKQYIGNQFCVVRYTETVTNDDIVKASVNCTKAFKKFIDESGAEWKDIVSVDDIKPVEGNKDLLQISGNLYNAKALKKMLKTFSGKPALGIVTEGSRNTKPNVLHIMDVLGNEGILLPLRIK